MNLWAPLRIWRIRLELRRRASHDQAYSIHLERRAPVRLGKSDTKPYWQYVNHIHISSRTHWNVRTVKLIIGCEATMRDANGHPRLSDVLELAHDQAAGVLTRAAQQEAAE